MRADGVGAPAERLPLLAPRPAAADLPRASPATISTRTASSASPPTSAAGTAAPRRPQAIPLVLLPRHRLHRHRRQGEVSGGGAAARGAASHRGPSARRKASEERGRTDVVGEVEAHALERGCRPAAPRCARARGPTGGGPGPRPASPAEVRCEIRLESDGVRKAKPGHRSWGRRRRARRARWRSDSARSPPPSSSVPACASRTSPTRGISRRTSSPCASTRQKPIHAKTQPFPRSSSPKRCSVSSESVRLEHRERGRRQEREQQDARHGRRAQRRRAAAETSSSARRPAPTPLGLRQVLPREARTRAARTPRRCRPGAVRREREGEPADHRPEREPHAEGRADQRHAAAALLRRRDVGDVGRGRRDRRAGDARRDARDHQHRERPRRGARRARTGGTSPPSRPGPPSAPAGARSGPRAAPRAARTGTASPRTTRRGARVSSGDAPVHLRVPRQQRQHDPEAPAGRSRPSGRRPSAGCASRDLRGTEPGSIEPGSASGRAILALRSGGGGPSEGRVGSLHGGRSRVGGRHGSCPGLRCRFRA